jgi:hypothetical protein
MKWLRGGICIAALVCAPAFASAQQAAQTPQDAADAQKVAIDPATGKLRQPTAQEAKDLAALGRMLSRPVESLPVSVHANGMLSVDLEDAFMDVSFVRLTPDGHLERGCLHLLDVATRFLLDPARPAAAPVLEEK